MAPDPRLDVITIGRSSVDLYGQQIGGRLEDMATFAKSVGGCPTNIAIGTARLGLKSGLITRVGDEQMGRFIREQCAREGVDVTRRQDRSGPADRAGAARLRDEKTFPLIFYRDDCADSALDEGDIDEAFIAQRQGDPRHRHAFLASQHRRCADERRCASRAPPGARSCSTSTTGRTSGGSPAMARATSAISSRATSRRACSDILPQCDLIVGTEEEIMIAGGADDPLAALKAMRAASQATLVLKRGPMGCVVFPGAIPDSLEHGVKGPGFPVEVYNVLGAGDAFMSGFLRGWLRDEPLETCCA